MGRSVHIAIALLVLLLDACQSLPGLQSSGINFSSQWNETKDASERIDKNYPKLLSDQKIKAEQKWWQAFNDKSLDMLIDKALLNNKDIKIAKARVEEARAQTSASFAELLPNVKGSYNATRGNESALFSTKAFNNIQYNLEATWEADLFGQNQNRYYAAEALAQSEEANTQGVMISLLAEVSRNYMDMRNYAKQIDIINENLKGQRHTLELIHSLRAESMATELDLQRAEAQVYTTQAQLPDLTNLYQTALNHLNILTGEPPGTIDDLIKHNQELPPLPGSVLFDAPASVMANRPDIKAAERKFASSISATKAAKEEIFPKISLTGLFGLSKGQFLDYKPWSIAANLVQPLISFGRIQAQIDVENARQKQAFLTYQKTVLGALEDMENALNGYINETNKNKLLHAATARNQKSVELVKEQFKEGYIDLLDVEVAERNLLQSQSDLENSDAKLRKSLIAIYAAAGGGWDISIP